MTDELEYPDYSKHLENSSEALERLLKIAYMDGYIKAQSDMIERKQKVRDEKG